MANKIIGRTDTSGAVNLGSITSNSKRPILVIGEGTDSTKEVIFKIRGTTDAATHFGKDSACNEIIRSLIKNGVKVIRGMCVGDVGTEQDVEKTVRAGDDGQPIKDDNGNYIYVEEGDGYNGATTTITVKELVGGAYVSKKEAYAAAFEASLVDSEIMVIILDTTDTTVYDALKEHLNTAESESHNLFRYGVVGVPAEVTDIDDVMALAADINSHRMFIGFPNVVDDNNVVLDGTITAAGVAAVLNTQTNDPALPTNNIGLVSFGGVASKLTEEAMCELADAGVVAIFPETDSTPTIWRMVTTAQKSTGDEAIESVWHDATTILIADNVLASVLAKLKANYRRTKNVARVLDSIRTDIVGILDQKLALEIIEEYNPELVAVVKDPEDRYGALADFEYKVVSPLYTITVTQHVKI